MPQMKFGIGFCESSGPALVRWTGNDVIVTSVKPAASKVRLNSDIFALIWAYAPKKHRAA